MEPLQIEILMNKLGLGNIADDPLALSGGLLHRMYAVQTTSGKYAVKALNPKIMCRPTAMQNFVTSELIANRAAGYVPALPAKKFNGVSIQQVNDHFYLVFDWINGKCLKGVDITPEHCEIMGDLLSSLHRGDFSDLRIVSNCSEDRQPTDWHFYLQEGRESHAEWTHLVMDNIEKLIEWNSIALVSAKQLSSDMVISHGDLDPKNVMWDNNEPILIDWECAGYRNPKLDLIETAIYWAENESSEIDKDKFLAFINGYQRTTQEKIEANWKMILASGFLGKLDWLEYSLRRSLWMDCTEQEEQRAGTEQVAGTLSNIRHHAEMISKMETWLEGI